MWIRCASRRVNLDDIKEYILQGLQIKFIKTGGEQTITLDTVEEAEEVINTIDSYFSEEGPFLDLTRYFIGRRPNEFIS